MVGVCERLLRPPLGQQHPHASAVDQDRMVRTGRRGDDRVEQGAGLAERAALDEDLGEDWRLPLRLRRHAPKRDRLERGTQLGLGLSEISAQVLRVATPQLDAADPEHRALEMGRSALGIPHFDGLVEIRKRKSDRSDQRHQTVRLEEHAAVERCPRKRADALGRACALRPVPGDYSGETLRTDAT